MYRIMVMVLCVLGGVLGALRPDAVQAASGGRDDWPCVQAYVPTISAATIWGQDPIEAGSHSDWRQDEVIKALIKQLASRRVTVEAAAAKIVAYGDTLPKSRRKAKLESLFVATLERFNRDRDKILRGIKRYVRRQQALTDAIAKKRQLLQQAVQDGKPPAEIERMRADVDWQVRIHEDREKTLPIVCEIPVMLEQRLFGIAREIAYALE